MLGSLLDKSLVRRTGERVWMLETIREFASEQLDAEPDANELGTGTRHYLALAEAPTGSCAAPARTLRSSGSRPSATTSARRSSGCSSAIPGGPPAGRRALEILVHARPLPRGP